MTGGRLIASPRAVSPAVTVGSLHLDRVFTVEAHGIDELGVEEDRPESVATQGVCLDAFEHDFGEIRAAALWARSPQPDRTCDSVHGRFENMVVVD
jgi:hypothetical protein